ncbi:hypothetical protein EON63_04265 [archaeon]|nr:MAG: hypothetical protein EON63_04265 [archaeon]
MHVSYITIHRPMLVGHDMSQGDAVMPSAIYNKIIGKYQEEEKPPRRRDLRGERCRFLGVAPISLILVNEFVVDGTLTLNMTARTHTHVTYSRINIGLRYIYYTGI